MFISFFLIQLFACFFLTWEAELQNWGWLCQTLFIRQLKPPCLWLHRAKPQQHSSDCREVATDFTQREQNLAYYSRKDLFEGIWRFPEAAETLPAHGFPQGKAGGGWWKWGWVTGGGTEQVLREASVPRGRVEILIYLFFIIFLGMGTLSVGRWQMLDWRCSAGNLQLQNPI